MSSEVVGDETRPGLGALSPETDATRRETWDDSSSGMDAEAVETTSGLAQTGNGSLLKEKLTFGELEDARSSSGDDDDDDDDADLAWRESSPRDVVTQQSLPVAATRRSQYHSIQQLSRPSPSDHRRLFDADRCRAAALGREFHRYPAGGVPTAGRVYAAEMDRSRDDGETQSPATMDCERTRGDSVDDEGLAFAECVVAGVDGRRADPDAYGHGRAETARASEPHASSTAAGDELQAKRARVEHIVTSMRTPPGDVVRESACTSASAAGEHQQGQHGSQQAVDGRRQRRKQFAPLPRDQRDAYRPAKRAYFEDADTVEEDRDVVDDDGDDESWMGRDSVMRLGLQRVQDRLVDMHRKYIR